MNRICSGRKRAIGFLLLSVIAFFQIGVSSIRVILGALAAAHCARLPTGANVREGQVHGER